MQESYEIIINSNNLFYYHLILCSLPNFPASFLLFVLLDLFHTEVIQLCCGYHPRNNCMSWPCPFRLPLPRGHWLGHDWQHVQRIRYCRFFLLHQSSINLKLVKLNTLHTDIMSLEAAAKCLQIPKWQLFSSLHICSKYSWFSQIAY